MTSLLLHGGHGADGKPLAVRCNAADGTIAAAGASLASLPGEELVDCTGLVLLPAPVEPHAHLDKALSGDRAPNPSGHLLGAIEAWHAYRGTIDREDYVRRARAAALELVAHGTTTIRSHVDVGKGLGLRALDALVQVRAELAADGLADLQLVALISSPVTGEGGEPNRALLQQAIEAGADVVGGCPMIDPFPAEATRWLVAFADARGLPIDLHVDESLVPEHLWLPDYAVAVAAATRIPGATAGHCVSLVVQPEAEQARIAAQVAAAGISVVTLPQSNLYLQARGRREQPPRGLTALPALLEAGVNVTAGGDNVRDPFNAVGRSDALETAAFLVMAGHRTPEQAWQMVSANGRAALGLPPVTLAPGDPAELLAVPGDALTDAIARAGEGRVVVHRGRVVARTTVATAFTRLAPSASSSPPTLAATAP